MGSSSPLPLPERSRREPRRRRLVLGLGNPLMGDDGVGWHLVEVLGGDPRLPADVEVAWGGTDLLGCAGLLAGRSRVVIVDAMEGGEAGSVAALDPWAEGERSAGDARSAHALAVPEALRLLRAAVPGIAGLEVHLLGVAVERVAAGEGLSPRLTERLSEVVDRVLALA